MSCRCGLVSSESILPFYLVRLPGYSYKVTSTKYLHCKYFPLWLECKKEKQNKNKTKKQKKNKKQNKTKQKAKQNKTKQNKNKNKNNISKNPRDCTEEVGRVQINLATPSYAAVAYSICTTVLFVTKIHFKLLQEEFKIELNGLSIKIIFSYYDLRQF